MNIELRDYFAAKAMSAYFTDTSVAFDKNTIERGSKVAYALADAMLAAREAGKPEKNDDGWIEWNGGECPVDAGVAVEIKFHGSNCTYFSAQPTKLHWPHIAAYRVQP